MLCELYLFKRVWADKRSKLPKEKFFKKFHKMLKENERVGILLQYFGKEVDIEILESMLN